MTAPAAATVLVVEDDEGIGGGLVRALGNAGYDVVWCRDAASTLRQPLGDVDVILLDLGLPDIDGLDLCRQLRQRLPDTPVVILTARGEETDIVVGLDAGADDYLVKPFRLAELLARLRAHTRRRRPGATAGTALTVGALRLDPESRRVQLDGRELELRPREFELLALLMRHAGKVVTRTVAMREVWDEHWHQSTKTLDVHIAALRQRLGESGPDGSQITTLRGVGYRLEIPPTDRETPR